MFRFHIKATGPLFKKSAKKLIRSAIEETAKEGLNNIRDKTPVRTGRLKGGWDYEPITDGFRVINSTPYTPYVERRVKMVVSSVPEIRAALYRNIEAKLKGLG